MTPARSTPVGVHDPVNAADTYDMSNRGADLDPRGADEPWTFGDGRDGLLIIAMMVGGLLVLFAIVGVIGMVVLLIFGFEIPID